MAHELCERSLRVALEPAFYIVISSQATGFSDLCLLPSGLFCITKPSKTRVPISSFEHNSRRKTPSTV